MLWPNCISRPPLTVFDRGSIPSRYTYGAGQPGNWPGYPGGQYPSVCQPSRLAITSHSPPQAPYPMFNPWDVQRQRQVTLMEAEAGDIDGPRDIHNHLQVLLRSPVTMLAICF